MDVIKNPATPLCSVQIELTADEVDLVYWGLLHMAKQGFCDKEEIPFRRSIFDLLEAIDNLRPKTKEVC